MEQVIKYARGTIWYVQDFLSKGAEGLQVGTRPCVIISSNEGNATNSTVIIAMITSKPKGDIGINVPFINDRGEENVVLCNQIHTVSKQWIKGTMLGVMTDRLMQQVEQAIMISLAINITSSAKITLDESFVKNIITNLSMNRNIIRPDNLELNRENKIKEEPVKRKIRKTKKSDEVVKGLLTDCGINISEINNKLEKDTENKKNTKDSNITKKTKEKKEKKGSKENKVNKELKVKSKNFWDENTKLEFIIDINSNGYDKTMEKWGIKSRPTAMSYYSKFKKELDITTERQKVEHRVAKKE